jgi:hypothetical protein
MGKASLRIAVVILALSVVAFAALTVTADPGHMPMHVGCQNHNHGPLRTDGAAKRLFDARALNRRIQHQSP